MFVQYAEKRLSNETRAVIDAANSIIEDYKAQGYRMTLRQLYYQFVSKNLITNEEKSYKKLASIISDGRLCGLIDWAAIEDRGRVAQRPHHYDSVDELLRIMKRSAKNFTLDKWLNQDFYVELWVEKQALAGVLEPLAAELHITLMVNKGYSSQSAMYDAAQRFRDGMETVGDRVQFDPDYHTCKKDEFGNGWHMLESSKQGLLLYLGDHDPSGEDMVRDISDRLTMFGVDSNNFYVNKVALTTAQVQQYKPPPNPAKLTDPRAEKYIALHGNSSWEVDALPPPVLVQLIRDAVEKVLDVETQNKVYERQEKEGNALLSALEKLKLPVKK